VRFEGAYGNNRRVSANDERLRVAVLDSIPAWGGGQKWDVQAAQSLARRGHFAAIACARGSALEARARSAGLPVWSAPVGRLGWRFGTALALARFLRRERIGLVIGNVGRDLRLGALACPLAGAALLQRRGLLRPVRRGPWNRWLYGRAVRRVIVNSEALRRLVLESAPWLAGRVALLPNAVDTSALAGGGARLRAELGLTSEAPLVGAVGRLTPMKGFEHLLGAWPLVLEKHPGARLVLFGDGELRGALEQQAARLGIAASVSLAGFREDVDALYDALDVFVLPSVRDESMSHAALEAMAHARPVVATEIASGGLEAARERGACRIVPTGDERALAAALAELLGNREARARMGSKARELALREHSLEVAAGRLEAILREALAEERHRAASRSRSGRRRNP
jgi:glycosyltransferase involved in cell wall biosynthesis